MRLSGAQAAIKAALKKMGGDEISEGQGFWLALREQQHGFFRSDEQGAHTVWRLSMPSIAPKLALRGEELIEWGGAQRWLKTDEDATAVRSAAGKGGGHATLFHGGDKRAGVFHPLAPAVAKIHRNLKTAFDPSGIFNPGRMYPQW